MNNGKKLSYIKWKGNWERKNIGEIKFWKRRNPRKTEKYLDSLRQRYHSAGSEIQTRDHTRGVYVILELSVQVSDHSVSLRETLKKIIKINLWLSAPEGATPVNWTSATDWQMAVLQDNVISIKLRQV